MTVPNDIRLRRTPPHSFVCGHTFRKGEGETVVTFIAIEQARATSLAETHARGTLPKGMCVCSPTGDARRGWKVLTKRDQWTGKVLTNPTHLDRIEGIGEDTRGAVGVHLLLCSERASATISRRCDHDVVTVVWLAVDTCQSKVLEGHCVDGGLPALVAAEQARTTCIILEGQTDVFP